MLTKEKILGCYWGLVLGDALGMSVEFKSIEEIHDIYGDNGIQKLKKNAMWTDDTEMTVAVSKSLLRLGKAEEIKDLDENVIGLTFAEEFIDWLKNPGHAPGITTTNSVLFLKREGSRRWRESGNNNSKGCGSVMRAAPLGIWFSNAINPELELIDGKFHKLLFKVSTIQSEVTHGHKAATAAALAGSYAVSLAVNGITPKRMIDPIEKYCNNIHSDFQIAMQKLKTSIDRRKKDVFKTDLEALNYIGQGWVGDEAFAMALYAAIQYSDDLEKCLQISVNHSGDSDSVACIAGSILGAFHGMRIIPNEWLDYLIEKGRMETFLNKIVKFFE